MDITKILDQYGIKYVMSGPNVAAGNCNVACPYCGDDPSHHLGINIKNGAWGCWRNKTHRGRRFAILLAELADISPAEAESSIVTERPPINRGALLESVRKLKQERRSNAKIDPVRGIPMPKLFKPIENRGRGRTYWQYLSRRGFDDVDGLVKRYDIRYAVAGPFAFRVIFPIYLDHKLVSWTGRAVSKKEALRYKTLTTNREKYGPDLVASEKYVLYNFDNAMKGGDRLIVVEGPVDCLKLDYYGERYGVRSVGLLTSGAAREQVYLLGRLRPHFRRLELLLDAGTEMVIQNILWSAASVGLVRSGIILPGKDPGELTPSQVRDLFS